MNAGFRRFNASCLWMIQGSGKLYSDGYTWWEDCFCGFSNDEDKDGLDEKDDANRTAKVMKTPEYLTSTVGRSWKTSDDAVVKITVCSWWRKIEMTVCYCSLLLLYCGSCECEWMGIKILICLHCLWHYLFIFLFALLYFNTLYLSQYYVATITKYVKATFTNSDVKASCKNFLFIDRFLWTGIQIFRFILFCRFALVLAFVL